MMVSRIITIAALCILPALSAHAGIANFRSVLSGGQEVPPVATTATGQGTATLDTDANTYSVNLSFSGLNGTTLFAHTHCCAPVGANAAVAVDFLGFPVGVTEGVYARTFDLLSAASYGGAFLASFGGNVTAARDAFVAGTLDELTYFNIHTTFSRPGEIRGQVLVPTPAAIALFGMGVLGMVAARRRV